MNISGIGKLDYSHLTSGKRINSAADDASGLAIANKLQSQTRGLDAGTSNAQTATDLLNVADGGLTSIHSSLQRMREISVRASNSAIYGADDLDAMQKEIEQLKFSIQDAAKGTEFNKISLLDGSRADLNIATNPDGTGMEIKLTNATLEALGIADYDVTGNFDMSRLDDAISQVSEARSNIGASTNALESRINYNSNASYNLVGAQSKIEDLDIPQAISDLKKDQVINEYKLFFQKRLMENDSFITKMFQ